MIIYLDAKFDTIKNREEFEDYLKVNIDDEIEQFIWASKKLDIDGIQEDEFGFIKSDLMNKIESSLETFNAPKLNAQFEDGQLAQIQRDYNELVDAIGNIPTLYNGMKNDFEKLTNKTVPFIWGGAKKHTDIAIKELADGLTSIKKTGLRSLVSIINTVKTKMNLILNSVTKPVSEEPMLEARIEPQRIVISGSLLLPLTNGDIRAKAEAEIESQLNQMYPTATIVVNMDSRVGDVSFFAGNQLVANSTDQQHITALIKSIVAQYK